MTTQEPTTTVKKQDKHGWSKFKRFKIVMLILLIQLALFIFVI